MILGLSLLKLTERMQKQQAVEHLMRLMNRIMYQIMVEIINFIIFQKKKLNKNFLAFKTIKLF